MAPKKPGENEPTVIVWRPEGVLGNGPPWREDDEVAESNAGLRRGAGQHREDARVLVDKDRSYWPCIIRAAISLTSIGPILNRRIHENFSMFKHHLFLSNSA